jgi:hypothetical protein
MLPSTSHKNNPAIKVTIKPEPLSEEVSEGDELQGKI